jgi:D-alanyl-lipoteichoic acid acyltransferase DltB (MBOAT superfamily)
MKWLLGLALVSIGAMSFDSEYAWSKKWVAIFLVGPWSFYLISAGSFDVQCFVARTWNLSLPMAWNAPFFRTNLSAFWANWNMTMTSLYRDYLFFNRWGLAKANIYLNAMIVFVAMGVWHALNWYWFIFGIYHGLGFCAYLWFQQAKKKYAFGMWISWWPVALVCWLFTYVFVCLGWLIPSKIVEYLGLAEGVTYD